jgi:hypothetical protein
MKWLQYGDGITQANYMIAKMTRVYDQGNKKLAKLDAMSDFGTFEEEFSVAPMFSYGFPQDKHLELVIAEQELRLRLNSRRRIMNKLGTNNTTELLKEIDDDVLDQAALDAKIAMLSAPKLNETSGLSNNPHGINQTNTQTPLPTQMTAKASDFLPKKA